MRERVGMERLQVMATDRQASAPGVAVLRPYGKTERRLRWASRK
jgi:hypothetical protein